MIEPVARAERRFRAMGTDCHVVVRSSDGVTEAEMLLDLAETHVRELESLWSRFRDDSEVSRLNRGETVPLSAETVTLLRRADDARTATLGWFDPFLAHTLAELGYDRTFDELRGSGDSVPATTDVIDPPTTRRAPIGEPLRTRSPLRFDADGTTARLDDGAAFDPGGIGKGLAADLVSAELVDRGAAGTLVNLGGDLRVRGNSGAEAWVIHVGNPFDETLPPIVELGITDCGLATSSPFRRRWHSPTGEAAHHILDPRNGAPAAIEVASITVTAPDAATAELLTTAVMLSGPIHGKALLSRHDARAFVVRLDGTSGEL